MPWVRGSILTGSERQFRNRLTVFCALGRKTGIPVNAKRSIVPPMSPKDIPPGDLPPDPSRQGGARKPARQPIFQPRAFEAAPVIALLGAMTAIHAWISYAGIRAANDIYGTYAFISARFWRGEALETALSYSLLHGDWMHLCLNGVALFALGGACWRIMGTGRFLIFFALTAIAGAILFAMLRPAETGPLVGASGSIFGLIAALKRFEFRVQALQGEETASAVLRFMALIVILNFVIGFVTGGLMAWEAHIGGFALGWVLTPYLVRFWPG